MTAVFAAGHWRKRDPLAGLTPAMLKAIDELADFRLVLRDGVYAPLGALAYVAPDGSRRIEGAVAPATLAALATRGLAEQRFFPQTGCGFYRATRNGRAIAAVIQRRAETRAQLSGAGLRARESAAASPADAGRRGASVPPCASPSPAALTRS